MIGPANTIARGLQLAEADTVDAAVLDVNMNGERIDPVTEALSARGIPIVFATGYGDGALGRARAAPIIEKPYTQEQLADALARA